MCAFETIGNDLTVAFGAEAGQLELNVMEPVIIYKLFTSVARGEMGKNGGNFEFSFEKSGKIWEFTSVAGGEMGENMGGMSALRNREKWGTLRGTRL